jgi:uncharacterized protein (TIGR03118 family)
MKQVLQKIIKLPVTSVIIISGLLLMVISSCQKETRQTATEEPQSVAKPPKMAKDFTQVNLVGSNDEYTPAHIDPNLINGWGIAFSSGGTAWVSAEGTGKSVVYNREGVAQGISPVAIPSPTATTGGHPSGQVFNSTASDFKLLNGNKAAFIFAGLDGVISGWNGGTAAVKMIDSSSKGAVYAGIALAADGGANFLYAANFSAGRIDVFDKDFKSVTTKPFWDPNIPAGYAPFNIQNVGGKLYVMYAKVDPEEHEEEVGPGLGYVDIYNTNGTLDKRFVSKGQLNAPWGVAWAPAGFFGGDADAEPAILIGNFGDGRINAYSLDGNFLGQLRAHGEPIVIEGLWAITFPPSTSTIDPNRLYFAAGPDDEEEGLFGYIKKDE